jgi:hypothetical protein
MNIDELIDLIFPDGGELATLCAAWCRETPRFRRFLELNSAKVRKKARLAARADQAGDLRAELAVAMMLLADRRIELSYEPLAPSGRRGPDFAAQFRVHSIVYVEVAHLRPASSASTMARLAGVLVSKLQQLQPGAANVLAVVMNEPLDFAMIAPMVAELRARAARGESFVHMRHIDPPTLLRLLPRLSALAIALPGTATALWPQPEARHALLPEFQLLIRRATLPISSTGQERLTAR